jgi:hypothetical protein
LLGGHRAVLGSGLEFSNRTRGIIAFLEGVENLSVPAKRTGKILHVLWFQDCLGRFGHKREDDTPRLF